MKQISDQNLPFKQATYSVTELEVYLQRTRKTDRAAWYIYIIELYAY